MTVSEFYTLAVSLLTAAHIPDPEIEASLLLGYLLDKSRAEVLLAGPEHLAANDVKKLEQQLSLRLQRLPLAYVVGEQEFWSLPFTVTPDVLIPRPETEQLLEIVLRTLKTHDSCVRWGLDLGAGSGVIASVLALELPEARIVAVDRSLAALAVVCRNIKRHALSTRVFPLCASWGQAVTPGCWDLIVSNPPYVAAAAMATLAPEVQAEPKSALDGGRDGMEEIRIICHQLADLLQPRGWFFMEIGFDQKELVLDLFHANPCFSDVAVHHDYAGLPRVLQARKK